MGPSIPRPNDNQAIQLEYIDDSSKVALVHLKKSVVPDFTNRPSLLNYHEKIRMLLDPNENVLQKELDRFQVECE